MLVNILEENNNCELIFSAELPNARSKRYIKKILKKYGERVLLEEATLEAALLYEFREEWIEEAQKRLGYNFLKNFFYKVENFKVKGKGHPIYFECISFFSKPLSPEHYKGFELELKIPEIDRENYINMRVDEIFYDLVEHHLTDENVKPPNKVEADIKVIDRDTGEELEELSESFFDFVETGTFPDIILNEIKNYKAGDTFEVEFKVSETEEDEWLRDEYLGQTLIYKIKINAVYREVVPQRPYTDTLAQKLGYENLEGVINKAKERQALYEADIYEDTLFGEYLAKVAENLQLKPTENMIFATKLELGIIDEDGDSLIEDSSWNSDEYIIREIFEKVLAPQIFVAEGMCMYEEPLIQMALKASGNDADKEVISDKVLELALKKNIEWLKMNIEKLVTVKLINYAPC
ncbi:MAG: hypothetical protein VKK32_08345 [Candidatus Melainabacteria bacterium]|nr:hypothetical protein [Candidatus Melainabacteria bacterium]